MNARLRRSGRSKGRAEALESALHLRARHASFVTRHASRVSDHSSFTIRPSHFSRSGFTIVELLVVMLVMVLAAAAVAPSFLQFRRRSLLETAARRTVALAGEARSLAVMRDCTTVLTYDVAAHLLRLEVEPQPRDDNPGEPAGPPPLNERQLPDARTVEYPYEVQVEVSGRTPSIRFSGDGRADAGEMLLEAEGLEPILLQVNPRTGRMRVPTEAP